MKTLVTAIVLFASVNLFASSVPSINAVSTTNGTVYNMQKLTYGLTNYLIGTTDTGEKIAFKYNEIKRFYKDGVLYEKVNTAKISGGQKETMLPVVGRRNDVTVYQQDILTASGHAETVWHVFVEGDYSFTAHANEQAFVRDFLACK